MSKQYRLTAVHPSGTRKQHDHPRLRDARLYLSYAIHDNGYAGKSEAQKLCMIKPGETLQIAGATFAIDEVTA